jgi:hypothetical protein
VRAEPGPTRRIQRTDAGPENGMFTIVLLLYLQQNLEMRLASSSLRGVYVAAKGGAGDGSS